MSLSAGDKIGHYEVLSLLGQGGMGEVYKARDTTLKRDVALKVLPAAFLRDPERMARFQREAEVLASLDHPNIGPIYGLVDSEDSRTLVLALIEGPTLADRIEAGPVPRDEAEAIAKQIIEALEYAHERGVIHRDLKPANVKITPEGVVKVLDFGLAKVLEDEPPVSALTNSPTLTLGHTRAGVILGTAAYMSPEQAVGRPVDRRSDIFSFGAVLYEMLTGKRAFAGETTPDVLESVVKNDPDWSKLPVETPESIRLLLRRCLAKDRKQRLQAIGEARITLENPGGTDRPAQTEGLPRKTGPVAWIVAGVVTAGLAALSLVHFREAKEESRTIRLNVPPPEGAQAIGVATVSPDGRRVAFVAVVQGKNSLWVRDLDSPAARPLAGTENARPLAWSPDSRFLAFSTAAPDEKIKKIDVASGSVQTVFDPHGGTFDGASWGSGVIVFDRILTTTGLVGSTGLWRIPDTGGTPTQITAFTAGEGGHMFPWFLPDGRHFLYTAENRDAEKDAIYVGDADSKNPEQNRRMVAMGASNAEYAPLGSAGQGTLLFVRERTLMAQPFDADAARTTGDAAPVAEQLNQIEVRGTARRFDFSVSQNLRPYGALAFTSGSTSGEARDELIWVDRSGTRVGEAIGLGALGQDNIRGVPYPAISPDGKTVAFDRHDPQTGFSDIWLRDLASGGETRFTFNAKNNELPVWSPLGDYIAFFSDRDGSDHVYRKATTSEAAKEEALDHDELETLTNDWSRDGRNLIEAKLVPKPTPHRETWVLPLGAATGQAKTPAPQPKAYPYLHGEFDQRYAKLSPDGKWLAYQSDETKRYEVWVESFPTPGTIWQVSTNGGEFPVWSRDGKELYFLQGADRGVADRKMMAVAVKTGSVKGSPFGPPQALFPVPGGGLVSFDVSKDGRFLMRAAVRREQPAVAAPFSVVVGWAEGLRK